MKIKLFLLLVLSLFFVGISSVSSQEKVTNEMGRQLEAAAGEKGAGLGEPIDPRSTLYVIIRNALGLLGFVFLLLTLYAGFLWMTAGGAEDNIEKAKRILTASVIGLAIILLSYSITLLVFKIITGEFTGIKKANTVDVSESWR